jgi:hypothetical protein
MDATERFGVAREFVYGHRLFASTILHSLFLQALDQEPVITGWKLVVTE